MIVYEFDTYNRSRYDNRLVIIFMGLCIRCFSANDACQLHKTVWRQEYSLYLSFQIAVSLHLKIGFSC